MKDRSSADGVITRRGFVLGAAAASSFRPSFRLDPPENPFQPIHDLLADQPPGKNPRTWVFTGDSITEGALHTRGWRSYPEHFAERVHWEMRRKHDVVINTGRSGITAGQLLDELDWRVLRFRPDVASVMVGMNDCATGVEGRKKFSDNLGKLITVIRDRGSLLFLQTPNPIFTFPGTDGAVRADLPAYVDVLRESATSWKVPLVDHYAAWSEGKKKEDLIYWLSDASIHPNQFGHVELARLIFKRLGIYSDTSPTCRLFAP